MLSVEQKLEGLPRIVYINLDEATERNEHMVSMFENFGVKNYTRFGTKRPEASEHEKLSVAEYGCLMSHITIIQEFAKTDEPYLLVMEDDIDISPVNQWDFTWQDILDRVEDFDILQLSRLQRIFIPIGIVSKTWEINDATTGAYIITNRYAKQISSKYNENGLYSLKDLNDEEGPVADFSLYTDSKAKSLCIFWFVPFDSQIAESAMPPEVLKNHEYMKDIINRSITLEDIFQ